MTATVEPAVFPDIVSAIDKVMEKRIRVFPCHANRASSIGDDCERRLVYERTNWREKRKHDVGLEYVFQVGNLLEEPVLSMMRDAGFKTIRQQEPFEYRSNGETLCSGHIDAVLVGAEGTEFVAEIKSMSPHVWESVRTADDMKKYPWTRRYAWQIHMYMFGLEIPRAIWILVNKSTGRPKQINVELDMAVCEAALSRCESINNHVKNGTHPERLEATPDNADICRDCSFFHLCAPAINHGELKLIVDAELASEVDEMQGLEKSAKRYDRLKESLKKRFEATGAVRVAIGTWLYNGMKRNWPDRWVKLEEIEKNV